LFPGAGRRRIVAMMSKVLLIYWNKAEAAQRAGRLRRVGHDVKVFCDQGGSPALKKALAPPPEVFVIDLSRLPSHGRAVAVWLRQQKATRAVPIVFVGGEAEKVTRVREQLPDAEYAQWGRIDSAIKRSLSRRGAQPAVPGTMDAYSGVSLAGKLGIKAGTTVMLLGAPTGFEKKLGAVAKSVTIRKQARGRADVVLLFTRSRAELNKRLPGAVRVLREGGGLWLAWPKKASGAATDLTQAAVREKGLAAGLVDYKIAAIDETWSGLKFARRGERRRR
jgi:CheY-like chemotaxis protein